MWKKQFKKMKLMNILDQVKTEVGFYIIIVLLLVFIVLLWKHLSSKRFHKLLEKAKSAEEFEKAYYAVRKCINRNSLYYVWCASFTTQLKSFSDLVVETKETKTMEFGSEPLLDLFNFSTSVCKYLSHRDLHILNNFTEKEIGMSVVKNSGGLF